MASDLNTVALTCRLTRDPELRHTQSGVAVCGMRVAWSDREKDSSGQWGDRSNYIDVTVWGQRGETAARYLGKGRRIAIKGRLRWREWESREGGKRQTVEITADEVVFLDYAEDGQRSTSSSWAEGRDDVPFEAGDRDAGTGDFGTPQTDDGDFGVPAGHPDDDIPF